MCCLSIDKHKQAGDQQTALSNDELLYDPALLLCVLSIDKHKQAADQQTALSNDELLYDPEMDADDERWVNSQRRRYHPAAAAARPAADASSTQQRRLPNSDAVLNCPACMSLLCLDCQRSTHTHTHYTNVHAPCRLRGCKNGPAPFPGRMSYKATKPGLVCLSYILAFYIVLLFIRAPFYVLLVFVAMCSVFYQKAQAEECA